MRLCELMNRAAARSKAYFVGTSTGVVLDQDPPSPIDEVEEEWHLQTNILAQSNHLALATSEGQRHTKK
jgi:hypothetical protein